MAVSGMYKTTIYEPFYRVSWGGVFAGAIVALSLDLLLSFLGIGIGLSTGTAAGIWMVIISIVSLFVGGWVSSRVTEQSVPIKGAYQGFITWGLVTIGALYMLSSPIAGSISGFSSLAGFAAGTTELVSRTALWGFVVMVLSACASCIGGYYGVSKAARMAAPEEKEAKRAA